MDPPFTVGSVGVHLTVLPHVETQARHAVDYSTW